MVLRWDVSYPAGGKYGGQRTNELEQMMGDVLDAMMSILVGYRAFLVSRATRIPLRLRRSWSAPARNISH
ncbi:MAG TPA: hypothetical protein VMM54_08415 [Nitrospirota bacterium]|nr:hypothetical protein [Nitrospirota bacterium]